MRLTLHGDKYRFETIGDLVEVTPNYGHKFAVHQTPVGWDEEGDFFRVSHVETGFIVSRGSTIENAIESARERMSMVGEKDFKKALEKARNIVAAQK